jgi:hypothetical protein
MQDKEMVASLSAFSQVEEKHLLSGHLFWVVHKDHDKAQVCLGSAYREGL